ncbi:unnamed protein product [Rotaria magnacalcarata]|uniref:C2 domain-containing protein n=2 Tax=Rotaria magnacalcarata TaxID=392030 RepID=A0A815QNT9_9BILA|nr:unnamed protein product [Rotaria magnacalcarata]CAF2121596.1 unnamed protein product [Rotaria magnacalcarata]
MNTHEPVWNERLVFNIHPEDDTIHFDVYDADVGDKDLIETGKVKLKNVFDDGKFDDWVKLPAHLDLSVRGEIHVTMNLQLPKFQLTDTNNKNKNYHLSSYILFSFFIYSENNMIFVFILTTNKYYW